MPSGSRAAKPGREAKPVRWGREARGLEGAMRVWWGGVRCQPGSWVGGEGGRGRTVGAAKEVESSRVDVRARRVGDLILVVGWLVGLSEGSAFSDDGRE